MTEAIHLDGKVDPANTATNTFTGVNFGTEAADRQIAAFIGARPNVFSIPTVTIGGVTATLVEEVAWTGSGATQLLLYVADVPTGTSGTISVAWSTTNYRCGIEVFGLYGLDGENPDIISERDTPGTFDSFALASDSHVIGAIFSIYANPATARIGAAHDDLSAGSPTISFTASNSDIGWTGLTEYHDAAAEELGGATSFGAPGIIAAWYSTTGDDYSLSGNSITTGTPTVDSTALSQAHSLVGNSITAGTPTIDAGTLDAGISLTGNGITCSEPTLESSDLSQAHGLTPLDLSTGPPTLDTPAISVQAAFIELVGYVKVPIDPSGGSKTVSLTGLTGGIGSAPIEGDVVIVGYSMGATSSFGQSLAIDTSGYTTLASQMVADTAVSYLLSAYKVMGASPDTDVSVSGTISSPTLWGREVIAAVYRGVDLANPLSVSVQTSGSINSGRPNPGSITPAHSQAKIVVFGAAADAALSAFTDSFLNNFVTEVNPQTVDTALGFGDYDWTGGAVDPPLWGGGTAATTASALAVVIALRPAGFAGNSITAGVPTLDHPTISQDHVISGSGITAGTPALGSSGLDEANGLTGNDIAAGTPSLDTGTVTQEHSLVGDGITAGTPTLSLPDADQVNEVDGNSITTGVPTLDHPTIAQVYVLTGDGITAGLPTLSTSPLAQSTPVTGNGITTGAPTLTSPTLTAGPLPTPTGLRTAFAAAQDRNAETDAQDRTASVSVQARLAYAAAQDRTAEV